LQPHCPLLGPNLQYNCSIATPPFTLNSNPAVQAAALQQHWPLSSPTLQYKLLHCNNTGHSQVQTCSTSCCIATPLATLKSNPTVQVAALQQHWPLSSPNLQYKLLHCNTTDHSQVQHFSTSCGIATALATLKSNSAIQAPALQNHWPLSSPTLQYKLLHCNTIFHSQVQPYNTSCCIATPLATLKSNPTVQAAA